MKIDLKNLTFIIPVYIESTDREINTIITLSYLTKYFDTNIIILEHDKISKIPKILDDLKISDSVKYIFSKNVAGNDIFHRTRFLNEMLNEVNTPVVVNYDVDIILSTNVYVECRDKILNGSDLIYPYFWGNSQKQVNNLGRTKIQNSLDINLLTDTDCNTTISEYGHCQFFNTNSYRNGGMENEKFISYGPEDKERGLRFKMLGYKVEWLNNLVYHIEHSRGINSSNNNPHIQNNHLLLRMISSLSKSQLTDYYNKIDYIKKYKR
jgi:hypothetical protein